jgi:hypothetical protein
MTSAAAAASSTPPTLLSAQWHAGHAVTDPARCCTAYRHRYVVYAATDNAVAIVDVTASSSSGGGLSSSPSSSPSNSLAVEARWRSQLRVFSLAAAEESIAFVCGHPERDVVCVGTRQHGLYVTSLSNPVFAESSKLPRTVTGDATFSATFLFTEEANYLAFSSLLYSRPSDPRPYRLSLWCLDTRGLLWRGAMAPLTSMCSFSLDLSFVACQAGKVCLFTVQSGCTSSNNISADGAGSSAIAGEGSSKSHHDRSRLVVLSRYCSAVEELQDASYTCCIASPAEGEDSCIALTTKGFLVAFHATSGSVTRWMDCKVPAAAGLSVFGDGSSLVLTGELARLFQLSSWEFQGKIRLDPPSGVVTERGGSNGDRSGDKGTGEGGASLNVFTSAVAADSGTLVFFCSSGAMSFYAVEPKAATHRLSLHRTSYYHNLLSLSSIDGKSAAKNTHTPKWLVVSSALWCWWTPQSLLFVSATTGALIAAYVVSSTCVTLHPASGAVIVYDTRRHALVAYGRTQASPVCEVGALSCASAAEAKKAEGEGQEEIISLASSATGESIYALVAPPKSALPPRLRRYRCGWGVIKKGDVSEKGFYMDGMRFSDCVGKGAGAVVAPAGDGPAGAATSLPLPSGTHSLLVHAGGGVDAASSAAADGGDRVVAVQRSSLSSVALSAHHERSAAPAYTHPDVIQRVLPCRGGLLVVGAVSCAFVQWTGNGTAFHWVSRPLSLPGTHTGKTRGGASSSGGGGAAVAAAAVSTRRPDVAALCVKGSVSLWQLSESPRLLTTAAVGGEGSAAVTLMVIDVEVSTKRVQLWTMGTAGVDAYQLGPVELNPLTSSSASSPVVVAAAAHVDVAAPAAPVTPVQVVDKHSNTERKTGRPALSTSPTPRAAAPTTKAAATGALSLPLPSKVTPPPPAAAAFTARQAARTPRSLTSTVTASSTSRTLSEARRQRRTASARAPSSRQLSERFDELTGFYARQKQEKQSSEHPRTPRIGAAAAAGRHAQTASSGTATARSATSSPEKEEDDVHPTRSNIFRKEGEGEDLGTPLPQSSPPPQQSALGHTSAPAVAVMTTTTATGPAVPAGVSTSVVDVSALTVDSATLRSAVATATGAPNALGQQQREGWEDRETDASPLPWSDSPPQRGQPRLHVPVSATPPRVDDAVLRSSGSTFATPPERVPPPSPPQVQLRRSAEGVSGSSSFTSSEFTVQARQLRESLLHLQTLLEQSEMAESKAASDVSLALADQADLDELASLLMTVAAQLHRRQVRKSAEST